MAPFFALGPFRQGWRADFSLPQCPKFTKVSRDFIERWHQSACNVWYRNGYVYLVMERNIKDPGERFPYWGPNVLAPVVMRGKLRSDLTKRENWLFSEEVRFRDIMPHEDMLEWFGVPFYTTGWLNFAGVLI